MSCDIELLEHKRTEAEREAASLRTELRALESHNAATSVDNFGAVGDVQRLREHVKKLELQRDLANQRCDNAGAKLKTLEGW